jgi:LL-diaminopimelate aminotransferase
MLQSWLPEGGTNLFQAIKAKCTEAEMRGKTLYRLSIGQPAGPALLSAREAAVNAVKSDKQSMHEYQDNGSPGVPDFAKRFINAHLNNHLPENVAYLPIPGIKPMLGLIPLACGVAYRQTNVGTMTQPGYPTPADWCSYLRVYHYSLPLNTKNAFRFSTLDIERSTNLLMVNWPHNPSGQIATLGWWMDICKYCAEKKIRLFNDGAYIILSHSGESFSLAEIAPSFPDLSWAEAYSASKVIGNGTGWRIGAIVGSPDFVADIATIKGNSDSGFVAPMAAGVLYAIENDKNSIGKYRQMYKRRLDVLIEILTKRGMKLAVKPGAGFFTLWLVPKMAFGKKIKDAQLFNFLMIERTGVVGVHFHPYIRYAVTGDVEAMAPQIEAAFNSAKVSY